MRILFANNLNKYIELFYKVKAKTLISLAIIISLNSCSDNDTTPKILAKEKQIGNIHFYVETSASMGGYFKNNAEFKTTISDLTTKIEKTIKPIDIWFIADSIKRYNKSTQEFSSDIATTKIADQKSSQLHKILANIAEKNDSNDVSILVSDCILSFPDNEITKNHEINKTEASNALKSNIYSNFSDLKKKGLATSVYAFTSKFYGTYYDYQNGKHDFSKQGIKRPYYIWVIADKDLLAKFNSKLSDISSFMPEKSLQFGLSEEAINKFDIIPQIERKGADFMPTKVGLEEIEGIKKNDSLKFCVALNLDNLPIYAKEINYLNENMILENHGCTATKLVKSKSTCDKSKLKSDVQIEKFDKNTHFIIVSISEMPLKDASIHIMLPLKYDTWYESWSVPDDKDVKNIGNTTFAFNHLIDGVKEAYETKNKNYVDFTLTLQKK